VSIPLPVRPLLGEPPALDLLNTEWQHDGRHFDYLGDLEGLAAWLADAGFDDQATASAREALVEARAAIRRVLSPGADSQARRHLDAVVDRGRIRLRLSDDGHVDRVIEVAAPAWRPAVLAAHNCLELLERGPDRIRQCDHPQCVLWFFDTSRNGTRRWCSMAGCGNRAKAQRHYDRVRGVTGDGP
jgi:predicted RNA-binding Zn ribbon-like protein